MNIGGLYYSNENLLELSKEEYARLLAGEPLDSSVFKDINSGSLLLVFDGESHLYFFEFAPGEDVERFLEDARFARCEKGVISLASKKPLREILETTSFYNDNTKSLYDVVLKDALFEKQAKAFTEIDSYQVIVQNKNYMGMMGCCSCGVPGCGAFYGWIKNHICPILIATDSACVEVAWLLPDPGEVPSTLISKRHYGFKLIGDD